jgi:O-antigen/teichoic acid export membrane protein
LENKFCKTGFWPKSTTLVDISELIYQRVFHEKMSANVKAFLKNLLYVGIGTIISTIFSMIFMILGGRILGPEEYGKFTLIQSISFLLYMPMALGFDIAMLKYTSEIEDPKSQSNIVFTSYLLVIFFSAVSITVFFILASPLSHLLNISEELFYLAIAFAGLYVYYLLTTSALRGLNRMRSYSIFQIVYAAIILLSFAIILINKDFTFRAMVYPVLIAYGITTMIIMSFIIRKFFRWKWDTLLIRKLCKYAFATSIGGFCYYLFTNADRLIINRYTSFADVGVYNAYYTSSITVTLVLWNIFNMVYFPTISKYENKAGIFKRINKLMPHITYLGILLVIICEMILLKLYGPEYPLNFLWTILAAVAGICIVIQNAYGWLLISIGTFGAILSSIGEVLMAISNIGLNIFLIPRIGIAGAFISIIISYIIGTIIILYFGKKSLTVRVDKNLS